MNITLTELSKIWSSYRENGVTALRLTYTTKGDLKIEARCRDDCEPYWDWVCEDECSIKDYAKLVTHLNNGEFYDMFGNPYTVVCKMEE